MASKDRPQQNMSSNVRMPRRRASGHRVETACLISHSGQQEGVAFVLIPRPASHVRFRAPASLSGGPHERVHCAVCSRGGRSPWGRWSSCAWKG